MSKYINKVRKNKAKNNIGTRIKPNGEYTVPGLDTLKELANKHYPTHTEKKETIYPNTIITKAELQNGVGIHWCSKTEIAICILDVGELHNNIATDEKTISTRQVSNKINNNDH